MGKYGKKKSISLNPLDYNICILGEGGIGKTTIAVRMCEKLVTDEGYIHFDIGREDGGDAIEGIASEKIEDFEKLKDVYEDIIENKDSDYPDLKVVIWDTLDELIPILEKEAIREWNKGKPQDKKADTINSAWTGFGKGQEHACGYLLDMIWNLKKVGVSSIIIGHVKRSDIVDPITQETYSKITADTTQKYFNWIKNKMHFVALAYVDREIVKAKTGRKNIVTQQDITVNKAVSESRVIAFRDDTFSVDSKSRFADIVDKIPFDEDEFVKAMTDAIVKEKSKSGKTLKEAEKEQKVREEEKSKKATEFAKDLKENKVDVERNEELLDDIKPKFMKADADVKAAVKELMADNNVDSLKDGSVIPTKVLESILELL